MFWTRVAFGLLAAVCGPVFGFGIDGSVSVGAVEDEVGKAALDSGSTSSNVVCRIYLKKKKTCPSGFQLVTANDGLNGDLNQDAGGKDIFVCWSPMCESGQGPIRDVLLQKSKACPGGWESVEKVNSLNGDLNQGAGGRDIYMCVTRDPSKSKNVLKSLSLSKSRGSLKSSPQLNNLSGDLNSQAGGKDIFFRLKWENAELTREDTNSLVEMFAPELRFDYNTRDYPMNAGVFYEEVVRGDGANPFREYKEWDAITTYYHVQGYCTATELVVTYWWFYGWQNECMNGEGSHDGDWERVDVTIDTARMTVTKATYWQHGDWYSVDVGISQTEDRRPVVFVGQDSHGSYHFGGGRGGCLQFDDWRKTRQSTYFDSSQRLINLEDPPSSEQAWIDADVLAGRAKKSDKNNYESSQDWFEWEPPGGDGISNHPAFTSLHGDESCLERDCHGESCNWRKYDECNSKPDYQRYTYGIATGCEDGTFRQIGEKVAKFAVQGANDAASVLEGAGDAIGDFVGSLG